MVEIIESIGEMHARAEALRRKGQIGLVPTMGALHEGHLSLIRGARKECPAVIVSIFVNPTQFGPGEDYESYPRDFENDCRRAESAGADIIFHPTSQEMYPNLASTVVKVQGISELLCGQHRHGHFQGVATVVAKLFQITKPHKAYFGEKDYQQLVIIKRMVEDLNMNLTVVGMPTIREEDGLAMSSRNVYLSPEERKAAAILYHSLKQASGEVTKGQKDADIIVRKAKKLVESTPCTSIEYVKIVDPETLQDIKEITRSARMALAVKVGKARLIDNIALNPGAR